MFREVIEFFFFFNFSPTCYRLVKLVLLVSALGVTLSSLPTYSQSLIPIKFDNEIIFKDFEFFPSSMEKTHIPCFRAMLKYVRNT